MGNYYDREAERYRDERRYDRSDGGNDRGQKYGGGYEGDRGWEVGSQGRYDRGYNSRYYTGDEQGRGFAGGRDLGGRSYRSSYDPDWNETPAEGGYQRDYGRTYGSAGFNDRYPRESERDYQGTNRPPDYGRDFQTNQRRNYQREGNAGDRDWLDRASDEVSSWFGDNDAERRRRMDKMRDRDFRGRGPKAYRRSDERIREDVNDRLTDHQYLDASDIDVSVKEGEVTLSGKVFDRTDKRLAEDVAESVTGVKNVQNNLRTDKNWDTDVTARSTAARAGNA